MTNEGDLKRSLLAASEAKDKARDETRDDTKAVDLMQEGARRGNEKIVKIFLEKRDVGVNTRGYQNMTALMFAAKWGQHSTASLLLDKNADPDLQDENGSTALMSAAAMNYADLVSELLAKGAKEDLIDRWGKTALQTAQTFSCYDAIKMFAAWKNPESRNEKLLEAASEGKSRLVRGLLISEARMEHRNAGGDQALHLAAKKGHNDVIRVLLEHGADINSLGTYENTALIHAANHGHLDTVRLLIEAGADMNLKEGDGLTALMAATYQDYLDIASELVAMGADKTITSNVGYTPLKVARDHNRNDIALILDNAKIPEDVPNIMKVLITATENGHVNVLSNLIKRGARLFEVEEENRIKWIKNEVGETLLQIATRYPQSKKQQYEQILKDYDRTGVRPKDTLNSILKGASDKSNRMAKLFISQKLDTHDDQSAISQFVSDIIAHTKSDHFDKEIFGVHGKFFKNTPSKGKETLLSSVLNLGLLKEREDILEFIKKIEENNSSNNEDTKLRMKQEVKGAVASSVGLRDCLTSIEDKFAWSKEKMILMATMSAFIYILIGTALYSLDVFTDINFSLGMFAQSKKNFTKQREICKRGFDIEFDKTVSDCKTAFHANKCIDNLRNIEKTGENCFENEQRFGENPSEWILTGIICAVHYVLPFLISFLIWIIYEVGQTCKVEKIFKLPLPPLTKFYRFLCDIKLYKNYADRVFKTEMKFEEDKKSIHDKIYSHEFIVNLSLIIEASVESSFQFFFQTTFQLPIIILAFTDPSSGFEWIDLIDWKFISIAMSFASFSIAYLRIR